MDLCWSLSIFVMLPLSDAGCRQPGWLVDARCANTARDSDQSGSGWTNLVTLQARRDKTRQEDSLSSSWLWQSSILSLKQELYRSLPFLISPITSHHKLPVVRSGNNNIKDLVMFWKELWSIWFSSLHSSEWCWNNESSTDWKVSNGGVIYATKRIKTSLPNVCQKSHQSIKIYLKW